MISYDRRATKEEVSTTEEVGAGPHRRQRRQKGKAKLKSKQHYRRNRAKIKRQSKQWRRTHKPQIKRQRRRVKRQPQMHKRRHAQQDEVQIQVQDVEFWDTQLEQEGQIQGIDVDQGEIQTTVGDKPKSYDIYEFLDKAALPFEDDEGRLLKVLDDLHELTKEEAEEDEKDDMDKEAYSYDKRAARTKPTKVTEEAYFHLGNGGITLSVHEVDWYPEKGYKGYELRTELSHHGVIVDSSVDLGTPQMVQWLQGALERTAALMQQPGFQVSPAFEYSPTPRVKVKEGAAVEEPPRNVLTDGSKEAYSYDRCI